jgi:methyl-accepting chemotaxis protein
MTDGSNDLETIKEILFTVARRYEAAAERMDATDERLERLGQKQERTQEQLDQLREDVDIAFQTISLMTENADREMAEFRSAILGLQTENHRIWEYLMRRYRNGNGDQP